MHAQINAASKSIIINFTNLSPDNLPDEPVKLKINKILKLRSFCTRFYVVGTAFTRSIFTNKDGLNGGTSKLFIGQRVCHAHILIR